jgi:hypothetical protein
MHDTYQPLKSRCGTPKGCGASDRTSMLCRSRLPSAKSTAKVPPFSVPGVPAVGQIQDYSGFGLKPQTPTPKSAQLASRARAREGAGDALVAYLGGAGIALRGYHRGRSIDSPDQVPQKSPCAATSKRACGAGAISTKASVSRWGR